MDGISESGSPKRGSLTSLHRQSSGSFSPSSKLNSSTGSLQAANINLNHLYKDLDKFTRYFIIKTVQVIVQARIGENNELKTECKPNANDWFNINITDIPEVSDKTKAALDTDGFSVRTNWRVCCEISLKTGDGGRVILEHWIISNKSNKSANLSPMTRSTSINLSTSNSTSPNQTPQQQGAMSSIYTIYNRMSLLLKTLMTTALIVPAFRLASRTSQADSCVICYRVYTCPSPYQGSKPNSANASPRGSINVREFVGPSELDHFCPVIKLGSIKTDVNELDVSLCYRTDVKSPSQLDRSSRLGDLYNKRLAEDCVTAAKQLLSGTEPNNDQDNDDQQDNDNCKKAHGYIDLNQRLRPPFAEERPVYDPNDPNLEIIESAFEELLRIKPKPVKETLPTTNLKNSNQPSPKSEKGTSNTPPGNSGSTLKSLADSFVWVDLKPPFASDDHNDINSFFHGPAPVFSNGFDDCKDQLAVIEAAADQIDEFVDNICVSDEEEEEQGENGSTTNLTKSFN